MTATMVLVAAVPGHRQSGSRIAVRKNALVGVGARFHQQLHHRCVAAQHRVVQGAMLVVFRHVHVYEFRPGMQQNAHLRRVARPDGVGKLCDVRSVDERFEFGPTLVTVGARQHTLGVVEGKRGWIGSALELLDFRDSAGVAGAILREELFRLLTQLLQAGLFG
jgi:hypothetical protein